MKYYDIHTHKFADDTMPSNCVYIHNLSQKEMKEGFDMLHPQQYFSCAIHPWDIEDSIIDLADVQYFAAQNNKIVAIGECGLDKLIDTPMSKQIEVFEAHIQLAENMELPLIIHCVKAWDELLQMYKKHKPTTTWVLHGYRGGAKQVEQLKKFGFYFSLGEFFNEEVLELIYPDRLFVETDESCINIQDAYSRIISCFPFKKEEIIANVNQNVKRVFYL